MEALLSTGEWLAIVLGGLIVRFAAAIAVLAALVVVLLPIVYAFEGGRRLLRRVRGIEDVHGFEWRRGAAVRAVAPVAGRARRSRAARARRGRGTRARSRARRVLPPVGTRIAAGHRLRGSPPVTPRLPCRHPSTASWPTSTSALAISRSSPRGTHTAEGGSSSSSPWIGPTGACPARPRRGDGSIARPASSPSRSSTRPATRPPMAASRLPRPMSC